LIVLKQAHTTFLIAVICLGCCCALWGLPLSLTAFEDTEEADYNAAPPAAQVSRTAAGGEGAQEQFTNLLKQVVDINTRFAVVFIAIAAAIMLLILLLLFRLGSIRNSLARSARDMSNTKEALRYLMDIDKQESAKKPDVPARKAEPLDMRAEGAVRNEIAIARVMAEMEKLAKRMDDLPQASAAKRTETEDDPPQAVKPAKKRQDTGDDLPAKKRLYNEEELASELARRMEALHIEIIEPAVGDKYDPLLHDEVDSKPSQEEIDGTIFRVIQNGLAYNNRVALKARVVVHRA